MASNRQLTVSLILSVSCVFTYGVSEGFGVSKHTEPQEAVDQQDNEPTNESPDQTETKPAKQLTEMELIVKIEELQKQIVSPRIPDRDKAEAELTRLGPLALDHLEIDDSLTSDAKTRLLRVRKHLENIAARAVVEPSTVTITDKISIANALTQVKQQTSNDVSFVDGVPDEYSSKEIELNLENTPFWPAIKTIMKKGSLEVAVYSGEAGQLKLVPRNFQELDNANNAGQAKTSAMPNAQAGIFNVEVTRVVSSRSLDQPNNSHTTLALRIRWEPRIQPISVDLALANLKIIDEFGKPISVLNEEAVVSQMVQPEIPELEFNVPLMLVDRQIEEIKSIEADINAVLPGRVETFKFKNIGDMEVGAEQDKAGVIVSFGGISKNEDLFGVQVNVGFTDAGEATESYHSWIYDNKILLVDQEGNEHPFVGLESSAQTNDRMGILYYFEVDPKNCTMVYKTPAAIVKQPIKVKLEKIPLP